MGIQKNFLSFAGGGPNTRSTQLFIAFEYLDFLGKEPWETPFGVAVGAESQATLDALFKGYGEMVPFNKKGIDQQKIQNQGNKYVRDNFPKIDFLEQCRVVEENGVAVVDEEEEEEEEGEEEGEEGVVEEEGENEEGEEEEEGEGEEVAARDLPRGPEELERLAAYEKSNSKGKQRDPTHFRDHLSSSHARKLKWTTLKHQEDVRGERMAMTAVGLLCLALAGFYYFHRSKSMSAAIGKRH